MIDSVKRYPVYKDSGVPSLGDVPEHWEVIPTGRIGRLFKGTGGTKADDVADGVPCVRYGDLYTQHNSFIRSSRSFVTQERSADYTPLFFGDVLFAGSGETIEEIGKSAVSLLVSPACCGGDVLLLRPTRPAVPEFLGYASDCPPAVHQKAVMGRGVTVVHIYADRLKYLWLPFPPLSEQAAIVRFLDHADWRIRRYIAAKKKLIALLNDQKQVTINSAVTRGLDPSVRLKPSGVEWLGDIPAHWEVVRAKRLFSPRRDLALPGDVQLSATQAYGVIPQAEFEAKVGRRVVKISMHLEQRRHVEKGDFVISMRSFQGGLERAWASGAIRSSYVVLKRAPLVDVGFFSYLFKSRGYIRALQATADFIRDGQDLNFGNFCDVGLPLVPLDEQKAIAASISGLTADIDVALAHTEREIALVREYRARLISDVVTGRLDVREAAERLPDEPEQPEPNDGPDAMTDTDDEIADDTNAVGEQVEV